MKSMFRRLLHHLSILVSVVALIVPLIPAHGQDSNNRGRKFKPQPPASRVEVVVLRDVSGKPIENAAVIFHLIGDKGNMELKTNEDGKTVIDVLETGSKVRLQVLAKGFQTYGDEFNIDKPEMTIEVKLKRPGEQYSIYKNHDAAAGADPKAAAPKDAGQGQAK